MTVRRQTVERIIPQCIKPTVKRGGGNVEVLESTALWSKKSITPFFIDMLHPLVCIFCREGFILQQGPKHTSKLWENYLYTKENQGVLTVMEFSSTVNWPQPHWTFMATLGVWESQEFFDITRISLDHCQIICKLVMSVPASSACYHISKGGHTKYKSFEIHSSKLLLLSVMENK